MNLKRILWLAGIVICLTAPNVLCQGVVGIRKPIPSQLDSTESVKALRTRLDQIFTSAPYRSSKVSASVWSISGSKSLYNLNGSRGLTPASTTKLFSTAAYFQAVGKDASIITDIRTDGIVSANGVLKGNLYVVGHGDALLSVRDVEELADKIYATGIRKIEGDIVGDGSFFDNQTNRAVYSGDHEDVQALPPITALTVNKGQIAVLVSTSAAGRTTVQAIPSSDAVELVTALSVAPRKPIRKSKTSRKGVVRRGDAPVLRRRQARRRRASASISSTTLPTGIQRITIHGRVSPNRTVTLYTSMSRPALATAGVLANRLRSGGITITGAISERQAPASANSVTFYERPFVEFASVVNKRSDNYLAEHVFKMVGAICGDHTNTAARARKAISESLDSMHVPRSECNFNDGSGLSRRNTASAEAEVGLLKSAYSQDWGTQFKSTLAIAAYDGTIRNRMNHTPAANNVAAKTGTLRNVSALAGYVVTLDGELLAFSFISNGPYVGSYKGAENLAAIALASFSYNKPLSTSVDVIPIRKIVDPEIELEEEE